MNTDGELGVDIVTLSKNKKRLTTNQSFFIFYYIIKKNKN